MNYDELKKLLTAEEYACKECEKVLNTVPDFEKHEKKHIEEAKFAKTREKMMREPDPEPDEALVSLMEAMSGLKYDTKDKSS